MLNAKLALWLTRNGMLAAIVAGLLTTLVAWDWKRMSTAKSAGRLEERTETIKKTGELNAKASQARGSIPRGDAAVVRLRRDYCGDC